MKFTGKFNGQHNSISNLYINRSGSFDAQGLFGVVETIGSESAEISDLSIINPKITGGNIWVGALVGNSGGISYTGTSHTGGWVTEDPLYGTPGGLIGNNY